MLYEVITGTIWVKELTMAIIGLPNCSSFIPLARQRLRAPAIRRPSVVVALRNLYPILFCFCIVNERYKLKKPLLVKEWLLIFCLSTDVPFLALRFDHAKSKDHDDDR